MSGKQVTSFLLPHLKKTFYELMEAGMNFIPALEKCAFKVNETKNCKKTKCF